MSLRTKRFTTHEKPDHPEPSARVEIVPEGFSFFALIFNVFWLVYKRLWLALGGYVVLILAIGYAAEYFQLPQASVVVVQLLLQVLLGFSGYDLVRLKLSGKGYKFTGVVVAETSLNAERRYYDHYPVGTL